MKIVHFPALFDVRGVLFNWDASPYRDWEVRLDPPQGQLAEVIFNNAGATSDGKLDTRKAVNEHANRNFFEVRVS